LKSPDEFMRICKRETDPSMPRRSGACWHKSQRYIKNDEARGRATCKVAAALICDLLRFEEGEAGFVYYYAAGFHYPADVFEGDIDVLRAVAFDGDEVGK